MAFHSEIKVNYQDGSSLGALEGRVGTQGLGLYGGAPQSYIDISDVPKDWITVEKMKWR